MQKPHCLELATFLQYRTARKITLARYNEAINLPETFSIDRRAFMSSGYICEEQKFIARIRREIRVCNLRFRISFRPCELKITKVNIFYVYLIDVLRSRCENYSQTPRARPFAPNIQDFSRPR